MAKPGRLSRIVYTSTSNSSQFVDSSKEISTSFRVL